MHRRSVYDRLLEKHKDQIAEDDILIAGIEPTGRYLILNNETCDPCDSGTDFDENPLSCDVFNSPRDFWEFVRSHQSFVPPEDVGKARVFFAYDLDANGLDVTARFSR